MADSIAAVHVEFTTSTAAFRAEVGKGAQAIEGFSAAAKRSAQGAAQAAGASGTYTASFGKLGEQVRGASASIGGFSQAFAAMGAKVSPAIKGMGSSLSALLAGGVTPLGIAIGVATAALSAFVGQQEAAKSATQEFNEKLGDQVKKMRTIAELREESSKKALGQTDEQRANEREINRLRADENSAIVAIENLKKRLAEERADLAKAGAFTADALGRKITEDERRLDAMVKTLAEIQSKLVEPMQRRELLDPDPKRRLPDNQSPLSIPADYEFGQTDPMDPRTAEDTAAANLARKERDRLYDERLRLVIEENRAEAMFAEQMREWEERQSGANGAEGADPTKGAERIAGDTWRPHRIEAERALTSIEVMSERAAESFSDGFGNAFADFATGAASAGEAFKSFAGSFLTDIAQMIAKQAALSALMGGASAVGLAGLFGGGAGAEATASLGGIGFATGGSFKVRGTGGTDSQPVAFWATPGEQVDVRTPGQMAKGGGGVTVNVFNSAPNTSVRTESREGPDGMEIRAYVEQVVSSDLERGGPISRTAERTHGLQRRGRRG